MLPARSETLFFADFSALRQAGLIKILAGVRPAEEKDYQQFVSETQFDYTRDLDALAGSSSAREIFFVARGRFAWERLKRYAEAHGGKCIGGICQAPASTPGRWASFRLLAPDLAALAIGENKRSLQLRWTASSLQMPTNEPVWVRLASPAFRNPPSLPPSLRLFASALQQGDSVLISAGPSDARSGGSFDIRLDAVFHSEAAAQAASKQLQLDTNMLKLALLRAHAPSSPGDLTGVVTAGKFEAEKGHVYGTWPVSSELMKGLE